MIDDRHAPRHRAKPINVPYGWIQMKGTDVCMDMHCVCGHLGHVDGGYVYNVWCDKCGRAYYVTGNTELVLLTPEEDADLKDNP